MLGPRGAFDEDAIPDDNDDEDLKDDPISQMDMTVRIRCSLEPHHVHRSMFFTWRFLAGKNFVSFLLATEGHPLTERYFFHPRLISLPSSRSVLLETRTASRTLFHRPVRKRWQWCNMYLTNRGRNRIHVDSPSSLEYDQMNTRRMYHYQSGKVYREWRRLQAHIHNGPIF